jgi:hypothetical protein
MWHRTSARERFLKMLMNLVKWGVFDKELEGRQGLKGNVSAAARVDGRSNDQLADHFLNVPWASARFDGKGRPGLSSVDDHRETWQPVLDRITETIVR